eukprot:scaffold46002_cov23-Tisochrysis_lutea.AAC.3
MHVSSSAMPKKRMQAKKAYARPCASIDKRQRCAMSVSTAGLLQLTRQRCATSVCNVGVLQLTRRSTTASGASRTSEAFDKVV